MKHSKLSLPFGVGEHERNPQRISIMPAQTIAALPVNALISSFCYGFPLADK